MSEYQYYEFQAIDRRLTEAEMQRLRTYSTRARITPTTFVNEYHWGDLRGDVEAWMERYFDAFLYFANWGTRMLKFRLPAHLIDPGRIHTYFTGESSVVRRKGDYLVLTFESELEGGEDNYDLDVAGLLSSMISLRTEFARGDLRALYLGWLAAIASGDLDDDAIEPPVPAGLGELNGSLQALADFLRVDADLLEVAAEASAARAESTLQRDAVEKWIATLEAVEKNEILTRLVLATDDTAAVATELQYRFLKAREASLPAPRPDESRRSVGELLRATERRTAQRMQVAARKAAEEKENHEREAAAARVRHLSRLAGDEPRLWSEIERLVATRLPKCYDLAVIHLVDLRDLATRQERDGSTDFAARFEDFRAAHARKPSLLSRLNRGGL